MPETIQTEQPQVVEKSGLDLLSGDPRFNEPTQTPVATVTEPVTPVVTEPAVEPLTPIVEPTAEEKATQLAELTTLGLKEGATAEEITAAKEAAKTVIPTDTWTLDTVKEVVKEQEGDGWKLLAQNFAGKTGIELPAELADTEEAYLDFQLKAIDQIRQDSQKFSMEDELSKFKPEERLIFELNKAGKSVQDYYAPFTEVAQLKALTPEALVRRGYELTPGWSTEMVDLQMSKITEAGTLDTEYRINLAKLDNYEKSIVAQHQDTLQQFTEQQKQVLQQKRNQESARIKIALDKVPTYMGRKIDSTVKDYIQQELTSGKYDNMPGTPEEKIEYALYRNLGKKGMEYSEARIREQITLEFAKKQHNVAPVITGSANRVTGTATDTTDGLKTVLEDPRFK